RMLDQLAQLEDAHADDTPEDTQPASDDPAPIAASRDAHESTADDEPVETPTERTAVLTPLSNEPPPTEPEETVRTKKKRRWPWIVAAIVAVLGIGYVGLAFATQDTLPATLTIEGVDVSGMSAEEATPVLEEAFAARAEREITVTVDEADDATATGVPASGASSYGAGRPL